MGDAPGEAGALPTTEDALLGGRLAIRQPAKGHRVGTDAILLAAAAPAEGVDRLVDVGAGVGAVALSLLARLGGAEADLIEKEADLAALAEENAARNGLKTRTRVLCVDVAQARERRDLGLQDEAADLIVTNPPFFEARNVRVSSDPKRASAYVFAKETTTDGGPAPLEAWIVASLSLLRPGGKFIIIHRPDALAQMLSAFRRRLGAIQILPVHPTASSDAHRLIVAGQKGAKGPTSLRPGLVLHEPTGAFTPFVQALHRGEAVIDWGDARRRRRSSERSTPR
jgi:tRNA1(Val) A37 N6-methylase TrmN6